MKLSLSMRPPGGIISQFLEGRALDEAPVELQDDYVVALEKLRRSMVRKYFRLFQKHYVLPLLRTPPPCQLLPRPPRQPFPPHLLRGEMLRGEILIGAKAPA